MTSSELRAKLASYTDEQFAAFLRDFGGDPRTREDVVRDLVDHPEYERTLCYRLGMKTEDEKVAEAASDSALSARRSMWVAIGAAIVAVAGLAMTWITAP